MNGNIVEQNGKYYKIVRTWIPPSENNSGDVIMGYEEVRYVPTRKPLNEKATFLKEQKADLRKMTKAQIIKFYKEQSGQNDLSSLKKEDLVNVVAKHAMIVYLGSNNNNNSNSNSNNNSNGNSNSNSTLGGKRRNRKNNATRRRKN